MADRSKTDFEGPEPPASGEAIPMDDLEAWFVREVLPLEAVLIQFLRRGGRSNADVEDLRQDLYERVCSATRDGIPKSTRAFVFTTARNLLIDRVRHEQVVPFNSVENLEEINLAIDEPAPDRVVIARQELRRLQAALDKLPERQRTAILMRKINGLTIREIAQRVGSAERTVEKHLTEGVRALASILYRDSIGAGQDL
ncbi:MAG: RNA polymerase sigma factor [Terriglobales bacterium]